MLEKMRQKSKEWIKCSNTFERQLEKWKKVTKKCDFFSTTVWNISRKNTQNIENTQNLHCRKIEISVKIDQNLFHSFLSEVFKSEKLFEKIFHVQESKEKVRKIQTKWNIFQV